MQRETSEMVRHHTYYLAARDETFGAHPTLGPALKRVWSEHRVTDACAYYEGASIWYAGGPPGGHIVLRVIRSSPTHPVEVIDLDPRVLSKNEAGVSP